MLSFLSSSSNILSHLATLNANLTFPFCVECRGERAADVVLAGQTSSATCNFFRFTGDGMLRLWCAAGGVKCEDCARRTLPCPVYARPDLGDWIIHGGTRRSSIVSGLSGRVGLCLRALW
jgi:hypothetical protein